MIIQTEEQLFHWFVQNYRRNISIQNVKTTSVEKRSTEVLGKKSNYMKRESESNKNKVSVYHEIYLGYV